MRLRTLFYALACTLPAVSFGAEEAKSVELRDGTIYHDVPIIEENIDFVILSVPEAPGKTIRVEKQFDRVAVKRITRFTPEEIDFKKLNRAFLDENAVNEQSVEDFKLLVERFLKKYPDSEFKPKIDEALASYQDTLDHLAKGDIKVDGEWVPKEIQDRTAYTIYSKRFLEMMKARIAMKDYRNALNVYEKLMSEYGASAAAVEAEKLAPQVGLLYERQLRETLEAVKLEDKRKTDAINELRKRDSAAGNQALKDYRESQQRENKEHLERIQKEREAGIKRWLPVNLKNISNIETSISYASTFNATKKREAATEKEPGMFEGKGDGIIKEFWDAIDADDLKGAREKLGLVRSFRAPEAIRAPMDEAVANLQEKKTAEEIAAREERDKQRKAEADRRAQERKEARERAQQLREENARKAAERRGEVAPKPAGKPEEKPAPAPAEAQASS